MDNDLFKGDLVRLSVEEPDVLAEHFARWSRSSEFTRLMDTGVSYRWSQKKSKEWFEKMTEKGTQDGFHFGMRTLQDDRLIGDIGLFEISWTNGEAFVGLGIGEPEYWGKGYGTDAMRILLRYAFTELNLYRVTLDVFEYNPPRHPFL